MVKHLYLLRHGQAEEGSPQNRDFERQLTAKGLQDASKVGHYFKSKGIEPDLVIYSPANRTTETFQRLNEQLSLSDEFYEENENLYEASARLLLQEICAIPAEMRSAIIIGHNPSITYLAEYVTGAEIGYVEPAGFVHIQVPYTSWKEVSEKNCDFIEYISPEEIH